MKKNTESNMLNRYKELRAERIMLETMMKRLEKLTEEDIIVSMNYEKPEELGRKCIGSSHTQYIAMNYKQEFRKQYEKELRDCFEKLMSIEREIILIEAAIKLLPTHLQQFIKYYIDENLTWYEIEELMHVSHAGVGRWKKQVSEKIDKYIQLIN